MTGSRFGFRRVDVATLAALLLGVAAAPYASAQQQQPVATATNVAGTNAASSANAATAGPRLSATIRRGEIDVTSIADRRSTVQWGRATGIVDATPDLVMRVVTDYARYREFLPHFVASRVLSRRGNNAIVYLQALAVRRTVTIWGQLRIFQRRPRGTTQIIEGRMMQGNVGRMDAIWEVTPIENGARSLVSFQFIIDLDMPLPDSVVSDENVSITRRTITALRNRVAEPRFRAARRTP